MQETQEMANLTPGSEDPLEKEAATHSIIVAWGISWTEEPGGLQSMGSQRIGYNLVTKQQWTTEVSEWVTETNKDHLNQYSFQAL